MTEIYFIRHAESDHTVKDEYNRPLTEKGINDAKMLPYMFRDISPDALFCSPYIRAVQTITPVAKAKNLDIIIKNDLRERLSNSAWIHDELDLREFVYKMWENISISVDGGESISELQGRNIKTITEILRDYTEKKIIIGTHGSALASIMNYYDQNFSAEDFMHFIGKMPYIIRMQFEKNNFISMENVPL